jgi:hypothetical protein
MLQWGVPKGHIDIEFFGPTAALREEEIETLVEQN